MSDRLKEIFHEYGDLISLNNPILSLLTEEEIRLSIDKLIVDQSTKVAVLDIIRHKKELDVKPLRKDRYKELIEESMKEEKQKIANILVENVRFLSIEPFPQKIAKLRNMVAHVKEGPRSITIHIWYFAVKALEFIGQLCILSLMKFKKEQMSEIFFLHEPSLRTKLEIIMETNISL